jgi:hypothetical protein
MVPDVVAVSCNQGNGVLRELYPVFFEVVLNNSIYSLKMRHLYYTFLCVLDYSLSRSLLHYQNHCTLSFFRGAINKC